MARSSRFFFGSLGAVSPTGMKLELGGNTPDTINSIAFLCLIGLLVAVVIGCLIDVVFPAAIARLCDNCSKSHDVPPVGSILLLLGSYGLLLPGLYSVLFSFNIMLDFGVVNLGVMPGGDLNKVPALTETMVGLVRLLQKEKVRLGANAVILYAMVIPSVKLALVFLGQVLRCWPQVANFCTRTVQAISKWACPDMFAYILMLYLVRGLNHPRMLRSEMQLDLGFTYFTLFCVGSTLASLGLHTGEAGSRCSWMGLSCPSWLKGEALMLLVMMCFVGFAISFTLGLSSPVMALRIDTEVFFQPRGPIPLTIWGMPTHPIVDSFKIPEKANADVSLWACMIKMREWAYEGEVNSMIGLAMVAFFVVLLTVVHMLVLMLTAIVSRCGGNPALFLKVCTMLHKLSMLDVLIMGVVVVTLCMRMYREKGIVVDFKHGLYILGVAEVLHHVAYYVVTCGVERLRKGNDYSDSLQEGGSPETSGDEQELQENAALANACEQRAAAFKKESQQNTVITSKDASATSTLQSFDVWRCCSSSKSQQKAAITMKGAHAPRCLKRIEAL